MSLYRSVVFGFDDHLFAQGEKKPVEWSEEFAINAHMLVAGKSGNGKTFTLKRIVSQMVRPIPGRPIRVHNFDVHGDISFPNESRVLFSESTNFGINPLRLSSDPHYGGVRKCVQNFINMMSDSAQLGPRQITAMRNVLYELFERKGFKVNDPSTWIYDDSEAPLRSEGGRIYLDVPYDERDMAKASAKAEGVTLQFDAEKKRWWCSDYAGGLERWPLYTQQRKPPTIAEAARLISDRLKVLVSGGGTRTVRLLEEHNKKVVAFQVKIKKLQAGGDAAEIEAMQQDIHNGAAALIETFTDYVTSIDTGHEFDDLARYESIEMLKSLGDRINSLVATGIFKPRQPPFDPDASVWSYDLAPLFPSEQQFFVWTRCQQIFSEAKEKGIVSGASAVRDVIVLDEADKFFSDKDTNILDVISKESRKFGISLIAASQAPSHFSEDFLGNVSTKILLGLDAQYRDQTVRKMRADPKILDYVVAGKIAAIQVADKRDASHHFCKTRVGN